jgi:hypothetical protein
VEAGTDRSAQDWFRLMVDLGLAPGLRELGFVGAGRRFRMEVDRHWAEVHLLQSASLAERRVRFTLNLRVLFRDEWTEQLRVRPYYPAPGPRSPMRTAWEAPIGELVTVGGYPIEDLWWELEVGQPFDSLAAEVLTALRTFGLPAISHHLRAAG